MCQRTRGRGWDFFSNAVVEIFSSDSPFHSPLPTTPDFGDLCRSSRDRLPRPRNNPRPRKRSDAFETRVPALSFPQSRRNGTRNTIRKRLRRTLRIMSASPQAVCAPLRSPLGEIREPATICLTSLTSQRSLLHLVRNLRGRSRLVSYSEQAEGHKTMWGIPRFLPRRSKQLFYYS